MKQITIILVDDHKLLRETWSYLLNVNPLFNVIAEADSGEKAVTLCKELRPDILLLDINLTGISGIETTPLIRKYSPCTRVIGVSQHIQPAYAKKMLQSGAWGYITKNSPASELVKGILTVIEGKKYICREVQTIIAENECSNGNSVNNLTLREIEIIDYLKQGLSSKEIASAIHLSAKTIDVHRYNILRKLDLKNTSQLINYVNQNLN
jgi:DNA-binding NarL/FixJ family response regulator